MIILWVVLGLLLYIAGSGFTAAYAERVDEFIQYRPFYPFILLLWPVSLIVLVLYRPLRVLWMSFYRLGKDD